MFKIIREFFAGLYRMTMSVKLRKSHVYINPCARFNHYSFFGGWNKIHEGSVISSSKIGCYSFIGRNIYLRNVLLVRFVQ